ncbi:MAG: DUF2877 domain-containing protein [Anaerolineales bacterium]
MKIIAGNKAASVIGVTNKGIFIDTASHQVLFISGESYCSPLTINLSSKIDFKLLFSLGDTCALQKDQITINHCRIVFDANTIIWHPETIQFKYDQWAEVITRSMRLAAVLIEVYQKGLFLPLLEKVTRLSEGNITQTSLEEKLLILLPGHEPNQPVDLGQRLLGLIGLGKGLTPAGDDFLVGFLLASHYLALISPALASQAELQKSILATAAIKTTTLSAALMQCAADGAADERLMMASRWLAQGDLTIMKVKTDLLSYGSSSGMDSFAGMLAAILLFSTTSP